MQKKILRKKVDINENEEVKHERKHSHLPNFVIRKGNSNKKEVIVEDISMKLVPILGAVRFAAIIHNLFTPGECADLIELAEEKGFIEALVHGPTGGEILRKDVRNCGRCIMDDEEMANNWFHRILHALEGTELKEKLIHAPWIHEGTRKGEVDPPLCVVGINERLRFLRYLPGQYFGTHQDNRYMRGPEYGERAGDVSHVTFLLYLNNKMHGGFTEIQSGSRFVDVVPETGSVLMFDHDIYHEACKVISGSKYCCRTEFMYTSTKSGYGASPTKLPEVIRDPSSNMFAKSKN